MDEFIAHDDVLKELDLDKYELLNLELQKGYADYIQGNTKSVDKAFSRIHEDYELQ